MEEVDPIHIITYQFGRVSCSSALNRVQTLGICMEGIVYRTKKQIHSVYLDVVPFKSNLALIDVWSSHQTVKEQIPTEEFNKRAIDMLRMKKELILKNVFQP